MVSRRRRLGKYATVHFAAPPWNEDHPDWIRLNEELPADHLARLIVATMKLLDLTPLFVSYSAGGTRPIRPDLMLRVVLIEMQQGRFRPAQWYKDMRENDPLKWAGMGIRPSRSYCYNFADRLAWMPDCLDQWNRQMVDEARRQGITTATRGAQDGSTMAANASRHRLLNEERLGMRRESLKAACAADQTGAEPEAVPDWMAKTPRTRVKQLESLKRAEERLVELQAVNERQPPARRRPTKKIVVAPGDPEAALGWDKMNVFRPLYNAQLICDVDSPMILAYDAFAQPTDAGTLKPMLNRLDTFGVRLDMLLADSIYATGSNLALCDRQRITLYAPWQENDYSTTKKKQPKIQVGKDQFQWQPAENAYRCPQGHQLTCIGKERRLQSDGEVNTVHRYRCGPEHCRACPLRESCTSNPNRGRSLRRSEHEELIETHKARMKTDEAKQLYKLRRQTIELRFADAKQHRNLREFSGRGLWRVRRQLALTVLSHHLTVLRLTGTSATVPIDPG